MADKVPGYKGSDMKRPLTMPNAHHKAMEERSEEYQDMRLQRNRWALFAIISITMLPLCFILVFYNQSQSKIIPYVLAVHDSGQVDYLGFAENATDLFKHSRQSLELFIKDFYKSVFSISSDQKVVEATINNKLHCMINPADQVLANYLNNTVKVNDKFGHFRIEVEFISINSLKDGIFQVDFLEHYFDLKGYPVMDETYRSTVNIIPGAPKPEFLDSTYWGWYIKNIDTQLITTANLKKDVN